MSKDTLHDDRRMPFFMIDNRVIDEMGAELGPQAIAAYNVIVRYANGSTGKDSFPSYKTIGDKSGMARSTAVKAVDKLVELGLVKKEARTNHKGQASNHYTVIDLSQVSPGNGLTSLHESESGKRTHLVRETDSPSTGNGHDQDTYTKNHIKRIIPDSQSSSQSPVQENAVPSTRKSRGTKAKATPPSPPRKPANATRKSKPAADPAFAAIKDAYIAAIDHHEPGAVHNHGQIGKGVKDLIAAGWTPAMVTEAIGLLKQDPYWRDKHLSIQTLGQQGAAKLNGHGPKASKPAGKPPLADWLLETYGVSDLMAAAQWNDKRKKEIELEYELL